MEVIFWLCLYVIGFLLTLRFTNSFDEQYDWQSLLTLFIVWPLFMSMCIIIILILLILLIFSIPEIYQRIKREIKRKYENRFKR